MCYSQVVAPVWERDPSLSCDAVRLQPLLLRRVAALVTRVLRAFGLSTAAPDELGFGDAYRPALGAVVAAGRAFAAEAAGLGDAAAPSGLREAVLGECGRVAERFDGTAMAADGAPETSGRARVEAAEGLEGALDALTGLRAELRRLAREDRSAEGRELGRALLAACDRCTTAARACMRPDAMDWQVLQKLQPCLTVVATAGPSHA